MNESKKGTFSTATLRRIHWSPRVPRGLWGPRGSRGLRGPRGPRDPWGPRGLSSASVSTLAH